MNMYSFTFDFYIIFIAISLLFAILINKKKIFLLLNLILFLLYLPILFGFMYSFYILNTIIEIGFICISFFNIFLYAKMIMNLYWFFVPIIIILFLSNRFYFLEISQYSSHHNSEKYTIVFDKAYSSKNHNYFGGLAVYRKHFFGIFWENKQFRLEEVKKDELNYILKNGDVIHVKINKKGKRIYSKEIFDPDLEQKK